MRNSITYEKSGQSRAIACFAAFLIASALILLYLIFNPFTDNSPSSFYGWFNYYILVYSISVLVCAYKLGIQDRFSKIFALYFIVFTLFSIFLFFLAIYYANFKPAENLITSLARREEIRNPSFWAMFFAPFVLMDWVKSPEVWSIAGVLVIYLVSLIKIIKSSLKD